MTERFDAIVIGAGANGLVAAATLARAGRRTLVLDAAEAAGGLARTLEFAPGFRAAPLALDADWMPPEVLRELQIPLPPRTYPDVPLTYATPGDVLPLYGDAARTLETIRRRSTADAAAWPRFVRELHAMAGFLAEVYRRPPPDVDARAPTELVELAGLAWKFRRLGRRTMVEFLRTMPLSIAELLDDWFEDPALKAAVATTGLSGIQQGPRSGGTAFVLLHHLIGVPSGRVHGRGYWAPAPDALNVMLEAAARRRGVTIRLRTEATQILVRDDAVRGVVTASGEEIEAGLVLSSADPAHTLLDLVDPVWLDPEFVHAVRHIKHRGATAFVLYGLETLPEFPSVPDVAVSLIGTVTLTPTVEALERAYDATKYGAVSGRPHVEITVPSLRWPSQAPGGGHVLVARVTYAPYALRDGEWDTARREALGDRVTETIACVAPRFGECIAHRAVLVPPDLEMLFGVTQGATSHGELTLDQILFMRPVPGWGRYAMPLDGLYLCGAGAHPGPGVVGGPGLLAARRALESKAE